jgi:hypothetical protein
MRHRLRHLVAGSIAALAVAAPLAAQDVPQEVKNFSAMFALSITPPGALPPMVTRSMIGGPAAANPQLAVRYGHLGFEGDPGDEVAINTFAATGLFSLGPVGTLSATIGRYKPDCDEADCDGEFTFGLGGDMALGGRSFGTEPTSPRLTLTLGAELGYTKDDELTAVSGVVNAPISLVLGGATSAWKVVPFLTPGFGYGRLNDDEDDTEFGATRFLLGGGLGLVNPASLIGVSVGFQRVFFKFEDPSGDISSKTLFGVTVTLGR